MTDKIENLVIEHLKRFQANQDRSDDKLDEIIMRLGQIEVGVASVKKEIAHDEENTASISMQIDSAMKRIERIERRLELS